MKHKTACATNNVIPCTRKFSLYVKICEMTIEIPQLTSLEKENWFTS